MTPFPRVPKFLLAVVACALTASWTQSSAIATIGGGYPWTRTTRVYEPLSQRIRPPAGYARVPLRRGSFGYWLRHLPVRQPGTPVRSYSGALILAADHRNLAAVIDLDLVKGNLQQCADTIIRLRAEYLWATGRRDQIAFRFSSGYLSRWREWARGLRPHVKGRRVTSVRSGRHDLSRVNFMHYLRNLFIYAGTYSLSVEGRKVARPSDLRVGDFWVRPGGPGHAVIVLDLARDAHGRTVALIGQSFMPAQDLHVMRPRRSSAWFAINSSGYGVLTPFWWPFPWSSLRRFH